MACEPIRISSPGAASTDIDEILDRESKAVQPTLTGRFSDASGPRNEGAEPVPAFAACFHAKPWSVRCAGAQSCDDGVGVGHEAEAFLRVPHRRPAAEIRRCRGT